MGSLSTGSGWAYEEDADAEDGDVEDEEDEEVEDAADDVVLVEGEGATDVEEDMLVLHCTREHSNPT